MANVGGFPSLQLASGHHPPIGSSVPKLGKNLNLRANRPPSETNSVSVAAVAEIASQVLVDGVSYTTHHILVSND